MKITRASRTRCLRVKTPKAFTLIELLVMISVIVMLMALLLPVLGRVRKQAKAVVCQAKLRQWGIAFGAYVGEHDGRMPGYVRILGLEDFGPRLFFLKPYITDYVDILLCPTTSHQNTNRPSEHAWGYHPAHRDDEPHIIGSYGCNGWLAGQSYDRVGGHAGSPVVFDCSFWRAVPEHYHDPREYEGHRARRPWWRMTLASRGSASTVTVAALTCSFETGRCGRWA